MTTAVEIPKRLVDAIIFMRGESGGRRWLAQLPRRIAAYSKRWHLQPIGVADGGAMSCCVYGVDGDGREIVMKIPVDTPSGRLEAWSLTQWSTTHAAPAVVVQDYRSGVFVMERLRPGSVAQPTGVASETPAYIDLLERMHATQHPLATSAGPLAPIAQIAEMRLSWAAERFQDDRYRADRTPIESARRVLDDLIASPVPSVLLHGDLQPKNVLRGPASAWYAIDPMACQGDLNADPALWAAIQVCDISIATRVAELASLSRVLDERRLNMWAYVFAVAELRPYLAEPARRMRQFIDEYATHGW